ncbi:MAG: hypothetical protein ABIR24_13965 [Verrucomicrobiota bacterium]
MNEPKHLENLLASWTLRGPSAKIRDRLFAAESAAASADRRLSVNWLAPLTVCALTMLVMWGGRPHSAAHLGAPDTNLFFASITMNSVTSWNSANSLKAAFNLSQADMNLEQNVWRMATFTSTNLGQTPSSMDSLPSRKTNSLMR